MLPVCHYSHRSARHSACKGASQQSTLKRNKDRTGTRLQHNWLVNEWRLRRATLWRRPPRTSPNGRHRTDIGATQAFCASFWRVDWRKGAELRRSSRCPACEATYICLKVWPEVE